MNAVRHDGESDVWAWVVGSGIALIQVCAIVPGLLPFLLLLLPFVLPLVVLGLVAGVLIGLPVALWRLAAWVVRRGRMMRGWSTRSVAPVSR